MKKIMLVKSNNYHLQEKPAIVVNVLETSNKNVYLKRKAMQPAYQELFQALLRLPDRQVQARVLDAINGKTDKRKYTSEEIIQTCAKCKQQQKKIILVDVATQTTNCLKNNTNAIASNSDDSNDTLSRPTPVENTFKIVADKISTHEEPKKTRRKQRRKLRVPQVIKKSQAKQMQQQQPPISQKRKAQVLKVDADFNCKDDELSPKDKRQRSFSLSSVDFEDACNFTALWDTPADEITVVKETMTKEYRNAEIIQADGLIPIHSAIIREDLQGLKRQIYVWKKLKNVDLNELCTEDDEDCLQLAVIQNKSHSIVEVLIQNNLLLNSLDDQSNTLIHLAVLNNTDVKVLSTLMEKIDLNMLLKLNDDGFTPLHLTIRQENFLQAEIILNALDKRTFGRLFYERESNESKENFLNFYEKCCERFEIDDSLMKEIKERQHLKRKLIDTGEMRSGNTVLFYAIEHKLEHFIYFFLAHFADPRVENHSGQNSRGYLGEYAKTLNLSLKIDRVMEQIEKFLDQ